MSSAFISKVSCWACVAVSSHVNNSSISLTFGIKSPPGSKIPHVISIQLEQPMMAFVPLIYVYVVNQEKQWYFR